MRNIAAIFMGSFCEPADQIPQNALRVVFDGTSYLVYEAGDNLPSPTADEIKSMRRAAINEQRDIDLLDGVSFEGKLFHSDEAFRADLTDMLIGYDKGLLTGTQSVRTKDNQIVQLGVAQILNLKLTLGQRRQAIFAASWAEKDAL